MEETVSFIEDAPILDALEPAHMVRMNVGRRWWYCMLKKIPDDLGYKEIIEKYIAKIGEHVRNGRGLIFHSTSNSSGKTSAAVIVGKAALCHGATVYFLPVAELQDQKFEKTRFDEHQSVWERVLAVDILILNDLGAEHGSPWAKSLVERIVRLRSNEKKVIIATTNMFDQMKDLYGDSTREILRAATYPVKVHGKNWRDDEAEALKRAIIE